MQQQGSVLMSTTHITTRKYGDVPGLAAAMDHMDVQGLYRTDPVFHQLWCSGELTSLTSGNTQESRPWLLLRQHSGAGPVGRGVGEPALRV